MGKLEALKQYVEQNREAAIKHCAETFRFDQYTDSDLFYRAVFCLLVPAGNAKRAEECLKQLQAIDYQNKPVDSISLYTMLRPYIRFPEQKAIRLHSFKKMSRGFIAYLRKNYGSVDGAYLRQALVQRVSGMGLKAASHFLRNMGVTDLAIIDTHILKYRVCFMPQYEQQCLPTSPANYLKLEEHFRVWAHETFNLTVAQADWLIWCFESGNAVTDLNY